VTNREIKSTLIAKSNAGHRISLTSGRTPIPMLEAIDSVVEVSPTLSVSDGAEMRIFDALY
jgi:hypothetical protein